MRKPKPLVLIIKIYFSLLTDYPRNITLFMVIFESETENLALLLLSLWGRYFFHVYPGYWVPACVSISRSVTSTIADPESHANSTLVDFLTDSFNVTHTVQILFRTTSMYHVDYSVNGTWCWTLSTVESEIPSPAACMAVVETKIATPEDTQPSSVWCFLKNALLKNQQRKKDQRGELKLNIRDKQLHDRVQKLIWKLWVSLAVTEEFLRGNMLTMDQLKLGNSYFHREWGRGIVSAPTSDSSLGYICVTVLL